MKTFMTACYRNGTERRTSRGRDRPSRFGGDQHSDMAAVTAQKPANLAVNCRCRGAHDAPQYSFGHHPDPWSPRSCGPGLARSALAQTYEDLEVIGLVVDGLGSGYREDIGTI